MIKIFTKLFIVLGLLFSINTFAQDCTYKLVMQDSYGDGWNGCTLTITTDGVSTDYTLETGGFEEVLIDVTQDNDISLFYTEGSFNGEVSYFIYNSDDELIFSDGPGPILGDVFASIVMCPTCFKVDILSITSNASDNNVNLTWDDVLVNSGYIIEYGPVGFPLGSGQSINSPTNSIQIQNLLIGCEYDFYITNDCGEEDFSSSVGPITQLLPLNVGTETCNYTLNLFDSYGDGWNGSILTFTVDGVDTEYTILDGFDATFDLSFFENQIVSLSYSPGVFEFEVSYELIDANNIVITSDGTPPVQGQNIYTFVACAACATPIPTIDFIGYDSADLSWDLLDENDGVMIEYGNSWFFPGSGTVINSGANIATLTGLEENTEYHFYISGTCPDDSGAKIGPFSFTTGTRKDVGISAINSTYTICDLNTNGELLVEIYGYGVEAQSLIPIYYSIDGVPANIPMPQDGFFTGVVGFEGSEDFIFETMFSISTIGTHTITAWTELDGDSNSSNDTLTIEFEIVGEYLPLVVDFDIPMIDYIDDGWSFSNGFFTPDHNNESNVWASNLYFNGAQTLLETPSFGIINEGDFFTLDYRYTEWSAGIDPVTLAEDSLNIYVSPDCGETWDLTYSVTVENHTPSATMTNISVDMAAYVGQFVQIRVHGVYGGGGDYWLDVDNLNILSCGPNLGLEAEVTSVTDNELGTILIVPQYGAGPFEYLYSDGNTDNPRTDVDINSYEVIVTDAIGCSSTIVVDVNHISATPELENDVNITLSPNPVKEVLTIDLTFNTQKSYSISIYNQLGQLVNTIERERTLSDNVEINMTSYSEGLYYILLQGENLVHSEKVMVSK